MGGDGAAKRRRQKSSTLAHGATGRARVGLSPLGDVQSARRTRRTRRPQTPPPNPHPAPVLDPRPRRDVEAGVRRVGAAPPSPVPALVPATPPRSRNDSLAPVDAPAHWLPPEAWVYNHWVPYDEGRLYALLHITREQDLWDSCATTTAQRGPAGGHAAGRTRRLAEALVAPGAARSARCARRC